MPTLPLFNTFRTTCIYYYIYNIQEQVLLPILSPAQLTIRHILTFYITRDFAIMTITHANYLQAWSFEH